MFSHLQKTIHRFPLKYRIRQLLAILSACFLNFSTLIWQMYASTVRSNIYPRILKSWDPVQMTTVSLGILHHTANFIIVNKPHDVNIDNGRPSQTQRQNRVTVERLLQSHYPCYYLRNVHQIDYASKILFLS